MAQRIKNPEIQKRKEVLANAKNKLLPQFSEKEMKAIAQAARTDFATYATLVGHIMQNDYQLFDVHNEITSVLQDFYDTAKIGINLNCPPRLGKQMAHSTPILTTKGWKKHGELQKGDFVFGLDGEPTKVIDIIPQNELSSYEVTLSTGEKLKVHPNHEWTIKTRDRLKWKDIETKELLKLGLWNGEKGQRGSRAKWQLPERGVIEFPEKELPLDPYFLGAWLGDGNATKPVICGVDEEVFKNLPYEISVIHTHKTTGVKYYNYYKTPVLKALRELNVFDNKHIPEIYLTSSVEQRLQLLAGLLDSDGTLFSPHGRFSFSNTNKAIINGIEDLLSSLNIPFNTDKKLPRKNYKSGIIGKKPYWNVKFNQYDFVIPTRIKRKQTTKLSKRKKVSIRDIKELPLEQQEAGKCITVANSDGLYLAGRTMQPTHNSSLAILFTSWYLGKNPHHNIGFITHTIDLSTKHNEKVRRIVKSPLFKLIFPNCVVSKSSDSKTRFVTTKGGSVSTYGRSGNYSGETFQLIILDDLVKGVEEIFSEATRETLRSVFDNIIQRIQTGTHKQGTEATQFLSIGTRYYSDDILSKFEKLFLDNGGVSMSYPVIANSNIRSHKTGEVLWGEGELICPELVGQQTVDMVKSSMTPDVYRALYLCEPLSDTNFFKKEWINYISPEELKTKKTRNFLAVDAALTVSSTSDETGFTIGMIDNEGKVYIKSWGEKLEPKDLMEKIFWLHDKYKFEKIGMEKMMYTTGVKPFMEDEMRRRNRFMPIELISHGNKAKEARVVGALPALYSSGTYWHIEGQCDKLETQMFNFPKGRHDDCFVAGTKVRTTKGVKNIEDIKVGDFVCSPYGDNEVIRTAQPLIKPVIDYGVFTATKTHKIPTQRGLIPLDSVAFSDIIGVWKTQKTNANMKIELSFKESLIESIKADHIMKGLLTKNLDSKVVYYTEMYGNTIMGKLKLDMKYIILMGIKQITKLKISIWLHLKNILLSTTTHTLNLKNILPTLKKLESKPKNGIKVKKEKNGIKIIHTVHSYLQKKLQRIVKGVMLNTKLDVEQASSVIEIVGQGSTEDKKKKNFQPTYNLQTKQGVYYANDVLVGNCIDSCALLSEVLVTEKYNSDDYGVTTQTGILPRTNNMY